jgi:hypothetical protein
MSLVSKREKLPLQSPKSEEDEGRPTPHGNMNKNNETKLSLSV